MEISDDGSACGTATKQKKHLKRMKEMNINKFLEDAYLMSLVKMNDLVIDLRTAPPLFNPDYDAQLTELIYLGETVGSKHPNLNQLVMQEPLQLRPGGCTL